MLHPTSQMLSLLRLQVAHIGPTIDVVMTSQSVLVRFVFLREGGLKRSRRELFAMYRTRAGRSVVCHKMTARVVPRHQGT